MIRQEYQAITMGCFKSKISPDYDKLQKKKKLEEPEKREKKIVMTDVTQQYEARKLREEKTRQHQLKMAFAAEELSSKVMEERERLSIHTKSRATSRATSRTGSPSASRRQVSFNTICITTTARPRSEISQLTEVSGDDATTPDAADPGGARGDVRAPSSSTAALSSRSRVTRKENGHERTMANGATVTVT